MSKGDVVRTTWVGTPHATKPEKKAPKLKKGGKAMKTMKAAMLKKMKTMGAPMLKKAMK